MGAEFVKESKVHTAGAISIRFPRILRIRDDKNWDDANTLEDIIQMAAQSGGKKKKGAAAASSNPTEKSSTKKTTTKTSKSSKKSDNDNNDDDDDDDDEVITTTTTTVTTKVTKLKKSNNNNNNGTSKTSANKKSNDKNNNSDAEMSGSDKPSSSTTTTTTTTATATATDPKQKALEMKKYIEDLKLEPIVEHSDGRKPIFVHGDVTNPNHGAEQVKIVVHFADTSGKWVNKGIMGAITNKWDKPKLSYEQQAGDLKLGDIDLVSVES